MEKFIRNIKRFIHTFPRKHHVEYITAILSIPVLLSVVALNLINLQNNTKAAEEKPPTEQQTPIVVELNPNNDTALNTQPNIQYISSPAATSCKQEIGPLSIASPQEGEAINNAPLHIVIRYDDSEYCAVVWSYRINGSAWSEYTNTSPSLYNPPQGDIKFELRVQSTVNQEKTESFERNFRYESTQEVPTNQVNETP